MKLGYKPGDLIPLEDTDVIPCSEWRWHGGQFRRFATPNYVRPPAPWESAVVVTVPRPPIPCPVCPAMMTIEPRIHDNGVHSHDVYTCAAPDHSVSWIMHADHPHPPTITTMPDTIVNGRMHMRTWRQFTSTLTIIDTDPT